MATPESQSARALSQARRATEGLTGNGGQFAVASSSEPGESATSSLSRATSPESAVKKVHISGRHGGSDVTPGALDAAALGAFMAGQCVAFAAEYADHLGTDVTYIYNRVRKEVIHAYVVHPKTKKAMDIRGARNENHLREEFLRTKVREHIDIVTVTPDEARNIKKTLYGEGMFKPASKVAKTFVHAVDQAILDDPINAGTAASHQKHMAARAQAAMERAAG